MKIEDISVVRNRRQQVRIRILEEHRAVDNKFIKLVKCYECKSIYYKEVKTLGNNTTETICEYCKKLAVHYIYKDDTLTLSRAELIKKINGLKAVIGKHYGEITRYKLKQRRLTQEIIKLRQGNMDLRRKIIKTNR